MALLDGLIYKLDVRGLWFEFYAPLHECIFCVKKWHDLPAYNLDKIPTGTKGNF